jgi:hypothetical protein
MPDTQLSLTVALCAMLIGITTACGTAPAQRMDGSTITIRTFRDASPPNGDGVCDLDPADTPESFALEITATSADGQLAQSADGNAVNFPEPPMLPVTITLAAPRDANYDIGVIDTLVITTPNDVQPSVVVNTFGNGVCRSQREFNAAIDKINRDNANSVGFYRALLALFGAAVGAYGLFYLLRGDWAWDMHEQGQRARGIVNLERTDEWESWRIISGGLMVICATVIVIIALAV